MNQVLPSKTHQVDSKQDYGPQVRTNLTLKKILHRVVKLILQGKGAAGALLFEVWCLLCFSRLSSGPPDDLSSCSFESRYAPRGPDTRTNDENTDSSGQPPGVGATKVATTYVIQSGGLWVPIPLSKPATAVNRRGTRAEATRRALTFKTRRKLGEEGKTASSSKPRIVTEWRRQTQAAKLEPGLCTVANQRNGPRPNSQAPGLLG